MAARILDGKSVAAALRADFAAQVGPVKPTLVAVIVGDNPASHTYVRNKRKACADSGFASELITLPATTTTAELLAVVERLNSDAGIHGILVQLPLPKQIDEHAIIRAVHPLKDVDCFHPENLGLLLAGQPRYHPCTPAGVVELVRRHGIEWSGKTVTVVGRSNIVGKPLAVMLMTRGVDATVTVAHTRSADLGAACRGADILVAAAGTPGCITPEMVKPGAVVVDVGTTVVDNKLRGDVRPEVAEIASWLSPVPGGVGPMTIAMLLANTLAASKRLAP